MPWSVPRMDSSLPSLISPCAARASSLARVRPVCPIFASPICCAIANCSSWPSRKRLASPIASVRRRAREAEGTEAERARVWARLKEAWQRRYGLVEAG